MLCMQSFPSLYVCKNYRLFLFKYNSSARDVITKMKIDDLNNIKKL